MIENPNSTDITYDLDTLLMIVESMTRVGIRKIISKRNQKKEGEMEEEKTHT